MLGIPYTNALLFLSERIKMEILILIFCLYGLSAGLIYAVLFKKNEVTALNLFDFRSIVDFFDKNKDIKALIFTIPKIFATMIFDCKSSFGLYLVLAFIYFLGAAILEIPVKFIRIFLRIRKERRGK